MSDGVGTQSPLDDILWIFREYRRTRDWATRVPSASLSIIITGILLGRLGFSPGITGAVTALGLATTLAEVVLRFIFAEKESLMKVVGRNRAYASLIYVISGLGLQLLIVEGAIAAPVVTSIQFILGLGITFIAGIVHMRAFTYVQEAGGNLSMQILISVLATIGTMVVLLYVIPEVLRQAGREELLNVVKESPKNLSNNTVNKSVIGLAS